MWREIKVSVLVAIILGVLTWGSSHVLNGWLIKALGGVTAEEFTQLKASLDRLQEKTTNISFRNEETSIKAGPNRLAIQGDGNIVVRDPHGNAIWNSNEAAQKLGLLPNTSR